MCVCVCGTYIMADMWRVGRVVLWVVGGPTIDVREGVAGVRRPEQKPEETFACVRVLDGNPHTRVSL